MARRRRLVLTTAATLLAIAACTFAAAPPKPTTRPATTRAAAGAVKTFESKEQRFTIQYPAAWLLKQRVANPQIPLAVKFQVGGGNDAKPEAEAMITVAESPGDEKTALTLLVASYVSQFEKGFKNYKAGEPTDAKAGGHPAVRIVATFAGTGAPGKQALYFFVRKEKAYVFMYTTTARNFDAGVKQFDGVIESLAWTE